MIRICQTCQRSFVSTHGRLYCSDVCRGEVKLLTCKTCKQQFQSRHGGRWYWSAVCQGKIKILTCITCEQPFQSRRGGLWYCSDECRPTSKEPAVYRFICPDGRSYVGSVRDCRKRANNGIQRSNSRLLAAFEQHPPETFAYEVLERLPPRCSKRELREAEQRHIDRLGSWSPEAGFNIASAIWDRDEPRPDLEARTAERAVMASDAAAKSDRHISKKWRRVRDRRKANQEEQRT